LEGVRGGIAHRTCYPKRREKGQQESHEPGPALAGHRQKYSVFLLEVPADSTPYRGKDVNQYPALKRSGKTEKAPVNHSFTYCLYQPFEKSHNKTPFSGC